MDKAKFIEGFHQGQSINAYRFFGAHPETVNGTKGVRFTVYAPHAVKIEVIASFTNWAERPVAMERTEFGGVWSVFVPNVKEYESYRYRITAKDGSILDKCDPYAFYAEKYPGTASRVFDIDSMKWSDGMWMKNRTKNFNKPLNIYEVYAGGWKRNKVVDPVTGEEKTEAYTYKQLKDELLPYVKEMGYTHIELLPLNEYPFDGSWGYQAHGYFSCTSRYGTPDEFAEFVNACHKEKIGVIMDIVPVHFVKDAFGLRYFDGEALYEYAEKENAESEWGTMNFNFWSEEVRSFLMSAAAFWCDVYHMDGLRLDAVSNLIFWGGNKNRGANEGSLNFLKRLNYFMNENFPSVMMIAEDSSDYPKVTHPTIYGGLGFDYKWDLGWMNDTLKYYERDPIYKPWHHHSITFSMAYFYGERFLMPFSHDENVHGKKTIIDRMWGTYEQKFQLARNLYAYMMAHPGKKLNFMGNDIGSFREFDERKELDWFLLKYPIHDAFKRYFADLNKIYASHPSLFMYDYDLRGFRWINADNTQQSIYTFYRTDGKENMVCVFNMTPASYENYDIFVPCDGTYTEILNSEKDIYNGCNMCNFTPVKAWKSKIKNPGDEQEYSITIRIAPFSAIWFTAPVKKKPAKKATAKKTAAKPAAKKTAAKPAADKPAAKKAKTSSPKKKKQSEE